MVSRTPYSLKSVCLKQLLSLRVCKLQEDKTTQGGLQAVVLATNPAAAVMESGFYRCSAVSFQWSFLSVLMRFMLLELPKAIEHVNVGAGVQTQQIWLHGLCYLTLSEARSWSNTQLCAADGGQDMSAGFAAQERGRFPVIHLMHFVMIMSSCLVTDNWIGFTKCFQ